ncbi:MAG TPA: acetyl-CoA carboxylase biotin carboxylase subunit [Candidatus Saccharimonadales bacterium]|jgi:acetyl-CoA carboxylase biotin carboxylase subunit|nr:acetyl-CoA carboxylase biotin carboxylase subunit [Candidatus Saccharimonadales bacterium]
MFKKILIANRGEIAVRVIRACREMDIATVAVFSEADRGALHVSKAGEAYCLGPAPARESYLNIEKIIATAKRSGAEAIHPGYGFLSENAAFARACGEAGIKFIGPSPSAMEVMGSKTRARQAVEKAGVPFVPGSSRGLSLAEAEAEAVRIGFPVMIKAAAGGGGKGMRMVRSASELKAAFETARSEAQRSFNDGEIYLEKLIENPRHIEIQVLGDEHGNLVYLGERECSVQRRHQKVMEEAPSAIVDEDMRRRMGEVAVQAAKSAGYTNAGTVEFLVDNDRKFYFLEMNTRLQVEHPVTEMVTGLDLVHLQLRIAAGEKLPFRQEDVRIRGHALECRVYAEDPDNNFFPSPGRITRLAQPSGPGIREDCGVYEGWVVPLDYDPMLSKLIVYAPDRASAIARMQRALDEYFVGGIKTNLALIRRILSDPDFVAARIDTGFLDRLLTGRNGAGQPSGELDEVAAISAAFFAMAAVHNGRDGDAPAASRQNASPAWKRAARSEALRNP